MLEENRCESVRPNIRANQGETLKAVKAKKLMKAHERWSQSLAAQGTSDSIAAVDKDEGADRDLPGSGEEVSDSHSMSDSNGHQSRLLSDFLPVKSYNPELRIFTVIEGSQVAEIHPECTGFVAADIEDLEPHIPGFDTKPDEETRCPDDAMKMWDKCWKKVTSCDYEGQDENIHIATAPEPSLERASDKCLSGPASLPMDVCKGFAITESGAGNAIFFRVCNDTDQELDLPFNLKYKYFQLVPDF